VGPGSLTTSRPSRNTLIAACDVDALHWAAKAVREAIGSMNAAVIAATSSAVVRGGSNGSSQIDHAPLARLRRSQSRASWRS
jgi:hypothetical protein